jgi:CCR4-NOT transcription complex subunit 1
MPPQMVSAAATVAATTSSVGIAPSAGTPTPALPPGPPEPRFSYHEIQVNSPAGLVPHIVVQPLPIFQAHPSLKQYIRTSIERAVQDWMAPVLERSIKIALTTCEQIVKKVTAALCVIERIANLCFCLRTLLSILMLTE